MADRLVPLRDCPIGLFIKDQTLCVKTEYGNQAYIISSGEVFWGGAKSKEEIGDVLVLPIQDRTLEHLEWKYGQKYKIAKIRNRRADNDR